MPQQETITGELDVTGATLIGIKSPIMGAGSIYYVNGERFGLC